MLPMSASTSNPSSFATRRGAPSYSITSIPEMSDPDHHRRASVVLIVPIIDERHHGADLLMIPISDDNKRFARPQGQSPPSSATPSSRTETPAAPTPPPKPQLPEGCDDWDSFLLQKKSNATLPLYENESQWMKSEARIESPELSFKHSFEQLGWRDCLNQSQRKKANARAALQQRPSRVTLAPTVYDANSPHSNSAVSLQSSAKRLSNASTLTTTTTTTAAAAAAAAATTPFFLPSTTYKRLSSSSTLTTNTAPCVLSGGGGGGGGGSSLHNAKRLSAASTLSANTVATAPCFLGGSSAYSSKRLSNASTLTTSTFASSNSGKPRSLRRINRARHLRAYYSDGALLRGRRLSVGISSMQGIAERREPELLLRPAVAAVGKRCSAASMPLGNLRGEVCAPPPYPPPEKPLPSLPIIEVRELQTGERTRWRELLLRNFPRRETSRRRAGSVTVR